MSYRYHVTCVVRGSLSLSVSNVTDVQPHAYKHTYVHTYAYAYIHAFIYITKNYLRSSQA